MTQEEKFILFKDLCARLPYDIKVDYEGSTYYLNEINPACKEIDYITVFIQNEKRSLCATNVQIEEIKPYLRPMSSMTDEERSERIGLLWELEGHIDEDVTYKYQDWLNSHHFDYRGLIDKGLALVAPKNMYNNLK